MIHRPIVPIFLAYEGSELTGSAYQALIDSGADWCLFHAEVGRFLGIQILKGQPQRFVGVEGTENIAYFHPVELRVAGFRASIKAGFVESLHFPYVILEQAGFFDHFVVTMSRVPPSPYIEILRVQ